MGERGIISYVFVFFLLALAFLFIFAIASPALQIFHIQSYGVAENLLLDAKASTNLLVDADVKASLNSTLQSEQDATTTNVDILGFFYTYAWVFFLAIVAIVMFIGARKQVETGGFG